MSIKVAIEHRTTYTFDRPIKLYPHVIRLRPAPHSRTPIEAYSLTISPADHFVNWQQDPFGNYLARVVFPNPAAELDITVGLVADMGVINPFDFFMEDYAETFPFTYPADLAADLQPYLDSPDSALGPALDAWLTQLPVDTGTAVPTITFLSSLNGAVNADIAYSVRMEAGVQTPDETLRRRIGSCRDSAWLLVTALRHFGLAARFVSGYLVQLTSDQQSLDGPNGPTEDFTDLHAWAEVYVPGAGWIGLDPTSALYAGEGHIPLAATPHPSSSAAISGAIEPAETVMAFSNTVSRVHEDPRVTKPYTTEQTDQLQRVGAEVDDRLAAAGIALTQGGEPTFVSTDDMVSPQWTVAADGPEKRVLANRLASTLGAHFAPGGLVQRSQGKWYPGEVLPRWQIGLIWRTDGGSLWEDPTLFADPYDPADGAADAEQRAASLAAAITQELGLPESQLRPCYDDPLAALVAEVRQPAGPRPGLDPAQAGPELVGELDAGETRVVAWALPLVPHWFGDGWASPNWRTRRGRLVLVPGDSPAGMRLPLTSLSWEDPDYAGEESYAKTGPALDEVVGDARARVVEPEETKARTALVVQAREGYVYLFLPPLEKLEKFAELVALVEDAAARTGTKVVLEGYGPPPDARIKVLMVTPDPGVIEVNVHPTSSWTELSELTHTLYGLAREQRLGTETFAHDGRHSGTGGGNHITLGGAEPAASPMLKRPDLLVSLITFWQHHPSLSYLFSGRFIGPTSQAPRFDEGRPENLYEMEISFAEIEAATDHENRPWVVDRALRHLLTDLTGNTHRAEFCIDKLYSPDSTRGRLGLLELRGFEMPPHPDMALVQALLVRALVARFAEEPYSAPLVRWGTQLHERFLLPHFAMADIADVVADLRAHGFAVDPTWFAPYLEFRFPRIGITQAGGVELELRTAIEPWHVLGEESTSGGTARYVDSSAERLQVRVSGFVPEQHLLTCNGRAVPLTPTGTTGVYVAGVRYRAWKPWSSLHPTLEIDSPLHFDVVDRSSRVSLGGATYHVVHPGGRSYDHPPVNAKEAEARRARRFEAMGHTTGVIDVDDLDAQLLWRAAGETEYPLTLDLRRHLPRRWGRP
ncbi:MAG: transglutaminase [Friedmanniella sp.]|nr:transglutaminase [Friedmanniella sp.]